MPYRITITVIMVIILIIVHNIETSTITTIIVMAKKNITNRFTSKNIDIYIYTYT